MWPRNIWFVVVSYICFLVTITYLSMEALLAVIMTAEVFPSAVLLLWMLAFLIMAWTLGIGVRRYIAGIAEEVRGKVRKVFVVASFVVILICMSASLIN